MLNISKFTRVMLSVITLLSSAVKADQSTIEIWSYYNYPPYTTGKEEGLTYDFIKLLNKYAKQRYVFELSEMNRKRLNFLLNENHSGLVLFVNPKWMGDETKEKFLWSSPILSDQNEILSPINQKIAYEGLESLQGLTFGGVYGRIYSGLEASFSNNNIIRYNVKNEELALKMLAAGRLDVTSQPHSVAKLLIKKLEVENEIYFSPTPLFSFTRHILITKKLSNVHPFIEEFITSLQNNSEWHKLLKQYHMLPVRTEPNDD